MTPKQIEQWNRMRAALLTIAKEYQTPDQLRRSVKDSFVLSPEEVISAAYENIQNEAAMAVRGVRCIRPNSRMDGSPRPQQLLDGTNQAPKE